MACRAGRRIYSSRRRRPASLSDAAYLASAYAAHGRGAAPAIVVGRGVGAHVAGQESGIPRYRVHSYTRMLE
jgi:hypothetical protein